MQNNKAQPIINLISKVNLCSLDLLMPYIFDKTKDDEIKDIFYIGQSDKIMSKHFFNLNFFFPNFDHHIISKPQPNNTDSLKHNANKRSNLIQSLSGDKKVFCIIHIDEFFQPTIKTSDFKSSTIQFRTRDTINIMQISSLLTRLGFERTSNATFERSFEIKGDRIVINLNLNEIIEINTCFNQIESILLHHSHNYKLPQKLDFYTIYPIFDHEYQKSNYQPTSDSVDENCKEYLINYCQDKSKSILILEPSVKMIFCQNSNINDRITKLLNQIQIKSISLES